MTIQIGDIVRFTVGADSFPGEARVIFLTWNGKRDYCQVLRADGEPGGGDNYAGRRLWIVPLANLRRVGPRSSTYPPTRYGPYKPIAKALPE